MATTLNHVIAQTVMPNTNGLPEDSFDNTWHFKKVNASTFAQAAAEIAGFLIDFFTTTPTGGTQPIGAFLSPVVTRTTDACSVKCYDGSLPPSSRVPDITPFTMSGQASNNAMPSEVALCLSERSFFTSTSFDRQRSRQYIGPFNVSVLATGSTGGDSRPSSLLLTELMAAQLDLATAVAGATHVESWCTYSTVDNVLYPFQEGFIDDAWDTQRRRGAKRLNRTIQSLP